jgi:hypothetical protein
MGKFFKRFDEGTWMHIFIIIIGIMALVVLIKIR